MGCSTSAYDNPELERSQAEISKTTLIKSSNGQLVRPSPTNSQHSNRTNKPLISSLKPSRVAPLLPITVTKNLNTTIENQAGSRNPANGRVSPVPSDATEARSVKRVAFLDDMLRESRQNDKLDAVSTGSASRSLSGSPLDRRRAKKKREKTLKKRLMAKMSMAESMSERMLLESERLSLTSSMSRATSRTGSPLLNRYLTMEQTDEQRNPTSSGPSQSPSPQSEDEVGNKSSALVELPEEPVTTTTISTLTAVD